MGSLSLTYNDWAYRQPSWYKRSELGTRVALFFSSATVAGAFSTFLILSALYPAYVAAGGLLASGIQKMDGVAGKPGWAWIFILEGIFTVLCAVASFWIVQDFPEDAKFLSEPERVWVTRRLQADAQYSAGGEKFRMTSVWRSLKDWKTYLAMG